MEFYYDVNTNILGFWSESRLNKFLIELLTQKLMLYKLGKLMKFVTRTNFVRLFAEVC
jgi:hypothetical protein